MAQKGVIKTQVVSDEFKCRINIVHVRSLWRWALDTNSRSQQCPRFGDALPLLPAQVSQCVLIPNNFCEILIRPTFYHLMIIYYPCES